MACPLSQSRLYAHMAAFYEEQGVSAWVDNIIPHFIVGNARFAKQYANVLVAALLDMQQNGDIQSQEEPVILLELGSGSGVLAWLLLQALTECLSSGVRLPPLLLVLSDVAASNVAAMQEPRAGFCEWFQTAEAAYGPTGPLETCAALPALAVDWAIVDCAKSTADLHLQRSQWHIQEGTLQNPLVLIGTYLLDSLPQDAFRCVGGQLSALWLDVGGVPAEEGQPTAQGLHESGDVTLEWVDVPLPEATHATLQEHFASYEEPVAPETASTLCTLLQWYQNYYEHDDSTYLADPAAGAARRKGSVDTASTVGTAVSSEGEAATGEGAESSHDSDGSTVSSSSLSVLGCASACFTLPVAALRTLQAARKLTQSSLVCLFGDKAHMQPDSFVGISAPHISLHGSFSFMVNFHALQLYCQLEGGLALLPSRVDTNVATTLLIFPAPGSVCSASADDPPSPATLACDFTPYSGLHRHDNEEVWRRLGVQVLPCSAERRLQGCYPNSCTAFAAHLNGFSADDFYFLHEDLLKRGPPQSLRQCLALCHMSEWEPSVLQAVTPVLVRKLPHARYGVKADAMAGLSRAWANCYPLLGGSGMDVAMCIGRVWSALGKPKRAIAFFKASLARAGPSCSTHVLLASAQLSAGHRSAAKLSLQAALVLDAGFAPAKDLLASLLAQEEEAAQRQRWGLKAQPEATSGTATDGAAAGEGAEVGFVMRVGGANVHF